MFSLNQIDQANNNAANPSHLETKNNRDEVPLSKRQPPSPSSSSDFKSTNQNPKIPYKAIIYRFINVLVTHGRIKDDFLNIGTANVYNFLREFWGEPDLMQLIDDLRDESCDDRYVLPNVPTVFKEIQNPIAIQDSISLYLNWKTYPNRIGSARNPHNRLIRLIVLYSLACQKAQITIHSRFFQAIRRRHNQGILQIVLSRITSDLIDDDRRLLSFTKYGDLGSFFDSFLSTAMYSPTDKETYEAIADRFNLKPKEILLVSSAMKECAAAKEAGLDVAYISRLNINNSIMNSNQKYHLIKNIAILPNIENNILNKQTMKQSDNTSMKKPSISSPVPLPKSQVDNSNVRRSSGKKPRKKKQSSILGATNNNKKTLANTKQI